MAPMNSTIFMRLTCTQLTLIYALLFTIQKLPTEHFIHNFVNSLIIYYSHCFHKWLTQRGLCANGWINLPQNQSPYLFKIMVKIWKLQLIYISLHVFFHIFSMSLMVHLEFLFLYESKQKNHKIFPSIWYGLMRKCSWLAHSKVHKYSFKIQFIIYFVPTLLWYDFLLIPSP
jgi:hypothetical protein